MPASTTARTSKLQASRSTRARHGPRTPQVAQPRQLMYNFRGVYDHQLTHGVAHAAGLHFGQYYRDHTGHSEPVIMVACDHRYSSPSLKHFVVQGLLHAGCKVKDVGCLPTSVVAYAASRLGDGACVITASHNAPEYNGLKFFESSGAVVKPEVEDMLLERVLADGRHFDGGGGASLAGYELCDPSEIIQSYVEEAAAEAAPEGAVRVAVDGRFGLANLVMPQLLDRLGCERHAIHERLHPYFLDSKGDYVNPEPKSDNVQALQQLVREGDFDLGLAFDGDADRAVIVDDTGAYLPDDLVLLALALEHGDKSRPRVITVDSSLMVERELRARGYKLIISPVGDPFVAERVQRAGASFGGVPNGHYIFPDFLVYSDGTFTAAMMVRITAALRARGQMLSQFIGALPATTICKRRSPFGRTKHEFEAKIAPRLRDMFRCHCSHLDYLETDDAVVAGWGDGLKLLVRYNRWDNNLNLQAESLSSADEAQAAFDEVCAIICRAVA
jgi:phosphoglucosamine mutase